MELGELVDHFRVVYLDDVSNQIEGQPDEMFGVESIVRLFQAAQDELARRSWCIIDDERGSVCTIDLDNDTANDNADYTDEQLVPYSAKIVRVLRVRFSDTSVPLMISGFGYAEPRAYPPQSSMQPWDVNSQMTLDSGRPVAVMLDADSTYLKFDRPLDDDTAALNLKLRVARKAITALTPDDMDASPEVPEDYHLALCDYVGKELLKGPNLEADAMRLRGVYTKDWEMNVVHAKREVRRRLQGKVGWRFGGWAR
jgi:hypothetical protein